MTAIVTVTDDGGSSGRLREDLKMLPARRRPQLSWSPCPKTKPSSASSFRIAFEQGELHGHSFGNLFVAALSNITGDFAQAVQMSSQILATRGRIYPATNTNVTLSALYGRRLHSSTARPASRPRSTASSSSSLNPPDAPPLPETLDAIAHADLITLGPGSLYTSLITNLLVQGIPEALANSRATRVYVCNLMTQANESLGLTASQHIEKIQAHGGKFDYALINTAPISPAILTRYAAEGQTPILADLDRCRALGVEPIAGNFVHEGDLLRHDYDKVAEALLDLGLRTARS